MNEKSLKEIVEEATVEHVSIPIRIIDAGKLPENFRLRELMPYIEEEEIIGVVSESRKTYTEISPWYGCRIHLLEDLSYIFSRRKRELEKC